MRTKHGHENLANVQIFVLDSCMRVHAHTAHTDTYNTYSNQDHTWLVKQGNT